VRFSFIVTSYNIEGYIGPCLDSLAPCLQPGDQLIVVDDGSSDRSCEEITAHLHPLMDKGIEICPIFLGANTKGGVGIPANIGLQEARGEAVFFVDGDDWVDARGILAARRRFETQPCDVLIANYSVYDAVQDRFGPPADQPLWRRVSAARSPYERQHLAVQMIGVPWRKIYRLDHLRRHNIRFPEGDFFYEDNPFHWQVCLSTRDIHFFDQGVCTHRVGRPGQTMAARGDDLVAFFDHYDRIIQQLPDETYRPDALRWLLENMAWHVDRLDPETHWIYACRAEETLPAIPQTDWQAMCGDKVAQRSWGVARALAKGDLAGVVSSWQNFEMLRCIRDLDARVAGTEHQIASLHHLADWAEGQRELQEFRALQDLSKRRGAGRD